MSESKHTSGPWDVVQRGPDQRKPIEVRGAKSPNALGVITGPLVCKMSDVLGRASAIANAHLIAAAPEMLDKLEEVEKVIVEWPSLHEGGDYLHGWILSSVRDLIAKAKGEL